MKRFVPTFLALALAVSGCAQQKAQTKDSARVGDLESKFAAFQQEQRARDAEIDGRLREISDRLTVLTSGKAPAPRGAKPGKTASHPPKRRIVAGQIVPYAELIGNAGPSSQPEQGKPALSAGQPAPMQSPQATAPRPASGQALAEHTPKSMADQPVSQKTPRGQAPKPVPGQPVAAQQQVPPPAPVNPELVVSPPVVSLGPSYLNVPPASQPKLPQPYTPQAKGKAPAVSEASPAPKKSAKERKPEPVAAPAPEPAPMAIPPMEPAAPPPPAVPAPPRPQGEAPAAAPAPAATPGVSMEEQKLYTEALRDVSSNKNDEGRKKFNEFISRYPNSPKTPEALYWIGESYMGDKSYNQAILSFKDLATRFSKDDKSAVATYRTAEAYELLGDKSNAAFNLKLLLQQYPNSEFAGKARQKLKQLGQ